MMINKSPAAAFLLSFAPGLGHLYLGRTVRGFLYGASFFGLAVLSFVTGVMMREVELGLLLMGGGLLVALINLIDMLRVLSGRSRSYSGQPRAAGEAAYSYATGAAPDGADIPDRPAYAAAFPYQTGDPAAQDRFLTIILSTIPGLGHLQLGLMQRGLAFMVTFFGLTVMVFFVSSLANQGDFFAFLGVLPIIWLYAMFDCVQQLNRKERGEPLVDRTVFEDFQESRTEGRKNRTLATLLSIFPGAGHMYMGLQQRGLQLMAGFLFSIYIMDVLHLSLFLFLIPILWFFSFFDALQHISRWGQDELRDVPVIDWLLHHQRWVGYGLLALGLYYLVDQVLLNALDLWLPKAVQQRVIYWFDRYFQTFMVCVLLIGGGLHLVRGSRGARAKR